MRRKMIETGLSEESLDILWDRYQNRETIKILIADFNLHIPDSQFLNIFPPISAGANCPYCTTGMVRNRKNRRAQRETDTTAYCLACGHNEGSYCKCDSCSHQLRERIKIKQEAKWVAVQKRHESPAPVAEHTLATASLPSLMASILIDLPPQSQPLTPNGLLDKWVCQAISEKIITLDLARCSPDAFTETGEIAIGTTPAYKSNVIIGTPPLEKGQQAAYILEKLQNPHSEWKKKLTDIEQLWLDIAEAECIEYLQLLINEREYRKQVSPSLSASKLRSMLAKTPTATVFAIIKYATKELSDSFVLPRNHQSKNANAINPFLDLKFGQAQKADSKIGPFSREPRIPRSKASEIFVDIFLSEAGDYCFNNDVTTWVNMQKSTKLNGKICCPNCDTDAIDIIQTDCQMFLICQECEQETVYALQ